MPVPRAATADRMPGRASTLVRCQQCCGSGRRAAGRARLQALDLLQLIAMRRSRAAASWRSRKLRPLSALASRMQQTRARRQRLLVLLQSASPSQGAAAVGRSRCRWRLPLAAGTPTKRLVWTSFLDCYGHRHM